MAQATPGGVGLLKEEPTYSVPRGRTSGPFGNGQLAEVFGSHVSDIWQYVGYLGGFGGMIMI